MTQSSPKCPTEPPQSPFRCPTPVARQLRSPLDLPEHSGKNRSAHKSSSSRTQTSILVAANTLAGGVASMGSGRGRKPPLRACARDAAGPHSGLARAPRTPNLRTKASTTPRKVKSPLLVSERAQTAATHLLSTETPGIPPLDPAPPPRCRCQPPQAAWRRRAPPNRPPRSPLLRPRVLAGPPRTSCSMSRTCPGRHSPPAVGALR